MKYKYYLTSRKVGLANYKREEINNTWSTWSCQSTFLPDNQKLIVNSSKNFIFRKYEDETASCITSPTMGSTWGDVQVSNKHATLSILPSWKEF